MTADQTVIAPRQALLPRAAFLGLEEPVAHLAAGGETPPLRSASEAMARFLEQKSRAMAGRDEFTEHYRQVKSRLARYLGLPPSGADQIAFLGSAAEGINRFADGLDWQPGDEIVALADEYPNALVPWLARSRRHGVRLVAVEPTATAEAAIAAAVSDRTRVICVSHVSYLNGRRLRLDELRAIADSCGAALVVDASQSLGVLPVDVELCDVMVSCCYKFILGIHGVGIFYCSRAVLDSMVPAMVGWHSIEWPTVDFRSKGYELKADAARLEVGNPPFGGVAVLDEGLKLLETVPGEQMEAHALALGREPRAGLERLGLPVWGPADDMRVSANIVFGAADADAVVKALSADDVLAWSGDGRVRLSVHGYNSSADVVRALESLDQISRKGRFDV